jgi:hypothetical protein
MRNLVLAAATAAALAATPALAQGQSGAHGPPDGAGGGPPPWAGGAGGGPGGAADGAGPPIDPPGLGPGGLDPRDSAHVIAEQRGAFGRDFAADQRGAHPGGASGPEQAALQRERAAQYYANAQIRREQAQQYSRALHEGVPAPADARRTLRDELRADIEVWRDTFRVGREEWQAVRDQWIADRADLTPEQWAQRRVDWFIFRDAWAAQHGYSQARAEN